MFLVLEFVSCSGDKYEQAIKDVYGKEVALHLKMGAKCIFLAMQEIY